MQLLSLGKLSHHVSTGIELQLMIMDLKTTDLSQYGTCRIVAIWKTKTFEGGVRDAILSTISNSISHCSFATASLALIYVQAKIYN